MLLRGGSAAAPSNAALVDVAARGRRRRRACPPTRSAARRVAAATRCRALMRARGLVDVLIPRGGDGLIRTVVEHVHGAGHRDRRRQLPRLRRRRGRPRHGADDRGQRQDSAAVSVCNAAETLLVHRRRRRRVPAARARRARRRPASRCTATSDASPRRGAGVATCRRPTTTGRPSTSSLDLAARVVDVARRRRRAHPALVHRPHRGDRHRDLAERPTLRRARWTRPP